MSHEGDEVYVHTWYDESRNWMIRGKILNAPRIFATFEGAKADAKDTFDLVAQVADPLRTREMTWEFVGDGVHECDMPEWGMTWRVTAVIVGG